MRADWDHCSHRMFNGETNDESGAQRASQAGCSRQGQQEASSPGGESDANAVRRLNSASRSSGLSNRIGGYSRKVALPRVRLGRVYAPSRPFAPHRLSRNQAIYTSPNRIACAADTRPWFCNRPLQKACPYCGSSAKWHARLWVYRIESGKATDALRRDLIKSPPQDDNRFAIVEEKATQQEVFFEWLEKIGKGLDLDGPDWLREVAIHFLGRKEPKTDWRTAFERTRSIRRSRRLESGWELDNDRLFLAPHLFDELLLVQYLISR